MKDYRPAYQPTPEEEARARAMGKIMWATKPPRQVDRVVDDAVAGISAGVKVVTLVFGVLGLMILGMFAYASWSWLFTGDVTIGGALLGIGIEFLIVGIVIWKYTVKRNRRQAAQAAWHAARARR